MAYYSNSTATFNIILRAGDVEVQPGPNNKCPTCEKTVRCNQKRCQCSECFNTSHASSISMSHIVQSSRSPSFYTCNSCLIYVLPFRSIWDFENTLNDSIDTSSIPSDNPTFDNHQDVLMQHPIRLCIHSWIRFIIQQSHYLKRRRSRVLD